MQDAANRVVQRMVIKKKKLYPFWLDHPQLHYAFHHVNNIPREIYCLKISRGRTWPRNVIHLDSSKKLRAQGEIREFREYAPFGTLNDLIGMHKRRKSVLELYKWICPLSLPITGFTAGAEREPLYRMSLCRKLFCMLSLIASFKSIINC